MLSEEKLKEHKQNIQQMVVSSIRSEFAREIDQLIKVEPNWETLELFDYYGTALNNLRYCLENKEITSIDPKNPLIVITFPIEATWYPQLQSLGFRGGTFSEAELTELENSHLQTELPQLPELPQLKNCRLMYVDLASLPEKINHARFTKQKKYIVTLAKTYGTWLMERTNGSWATIHDPIISGYLLQIDEPERTELLNSICAPTHTGDKNIIISFNFPIGNKHLTGEIHIDIRPLEINEATCECYLPVMASIEFRTATNLSDLSALERKVFWRIIFWLFLEEKEKLTNYRELSPHWHTIPINPIIATTFSAILKGGKDALILERGWKENAEGHLIYIQKDVENGAQVDVYLKNNTLSYSKEYLWELIEKLCPFTIDVALAVLAELGDPTYGENHKYPLLKPLKINLNTILSHKNIARYGQEQEEKKAKINEQLHLLSLFHFDIENCPVINPETGKEDITFSGKGFPLFHMKVVDENNWLIVAGEWSYWWLNSYGCQYTTKLPKQLIELDHRGKALRKKLGFFFIACSALTQIKPSIKYKIQNLLEDVGEFPSKEEDREDNWARRTKDSLDKAMLDLKEQGIFTQVEWPDGYGPDCLDYSKGWVEKWLDTHVKVTLPETPPKKELIQKPKIDIDPRFLIYGNKVRSHRMRKGLDQIDLANYLGISRQHLSNIENGKPTISEDLRRKIDEWLNT